MKNKIKEIRSEDLIKELILRIGDDPKRVGLKNTPKRVSSMWNELYGGYDKKKKPKITTFPNGEDGVVYDEMIIDGGSFSSTCEHHLLPFFGRYVFAYIPDKKGNILGLSKVARVVDYCSSKFQIQERLTVEIVDMLWKALSDGANRPKGMALVMYGTHMCKVMRGIKKEGLMTTIHLKGLFKTNLSTREEFLNIVNFYKDK